MHQLKPSKSLTLIELIIALVIMGIVMASVETMHIAFVGMAQKNVYQNMLYQNTSNTLERILKDIRVAQSVEVPDDHTLILSAISQYYFSNGTLYYKPDDSSPAQTILSNVVGFQVAGVNQISGTFFKAARIAIKAKDPQNRIDTVASLQSLAYGRLIKSSPVRLVDNETTPTNPQFFDTIQAAIDAADATSNIIQVTHEATAYSENLTINKAVTLKGCYDSGDWSRHLGDPEYETVVDGGGSITTPVMNINPQASAQLAIEISGFTITNGSTGISLDMANAQAGSSVTISNNALGNNFADQFILSNYANSSFTFSNNSVTITGTQQGVNIASNNDAITIDANNITTSNANNVSAILLNSSATVADTITFSGNNITITNSDMINAFQLTLTRGALILRNNTVNTSTSTHTNAVYIANQGETTVDIFNNNFIAALKKGIAIQSQSGNLPITIANNNITNFLYGIYLSGIIPPQEYPSILISNNLIQNSYEAFSGYDCGKYNIYNNSFIGGSGERMEFYGGYGVSLPNSFDITNNIIQAPVGISLLGNMSTSVISHNTFTNSSYAIGLQTPSIDLAFSYNVFNGSGITSAIWIANPYGKISFSHNIISGYSYPGIAVSMAMGGPPLKFSSINDTIINNSPTGISISNAVFDSFTVKNSILYGGQTTGIRESGCTFNNPPSVTYSDTQCSGALDCSTGAPNQNIAVDASFVNPQTDFHLNDGSPCIDKGDPDPSFNDACLYPGCSPDQALPPAKGTKLNDMGAYGGLGPNEHIGYVEPEADDPATPYIRENRVGTY